MTPDAAKMEVAARLGGNGKRVGPKTSPFASTEVTQQCACASALLADEIEHAATMMRRSRVHSASESFYSDLSSALTSARSGAHLHEFKLLLIEMEQLEAQTLESLKQFVRQ